MAKKTEKKNSIFSGTSPKVEDTSSEVPVEENKASEVEEALASKEEVIAGLEEEVSDLEAKLRDAELKIDGLKNTIHDLEGKLNGDKAQPVPKAVVIERSEVRQVVSELYSTKGAKACHNVFSIVGYNVERLSQIPVEHHGKVLALAKQALDG